MSTRAVTDLGSKVDDQIHARKLEGNNKAAELRATRLNYWMQMGGDMEFQRAPQWGKANTGGAQGTSGTQGSQAASGATESTNADGVQAQVAERAEGMGMFSGGIVAGEKKHTLQATSTLKMQMTRAMSPLANLIAEAPPEGVFAPATPFVLGSAVGQRLNIRTGTIGQPEGTQTRSGQLPDGQQPFTFPLGSGTFKKVGEFSAVFSSSEKSLVLNALQRVYDGQLQALSNPAVHSDDAATAAMQITDNMSKITKALGPMMGEMTLQVQQSGYGSAATNWTDKIKKHNPLGPVNWQGGKPDAAPPTEEAPPAEAPPAETPPAETPSVPGKTGSEQSGDVNGRIGAVDALQKRIEQALAGVDPDALAAIANMDIDTMVQTVLAEISKDSELEVRKLAEKMQVNNSMKRKQRELQSLYRHAKAELGDAMRKEFEELKAKGIIGDGVTFDEYKGWRQVCVSEPARDPMTGELLVDAEGKILMTPPSVAQPSPPVDLPGFLTEDKKTEAADSSKAGGPSNSGSNLGGRGGEWGITDDQYDMLKEFFMNYAGPAAWDLTGRTTEGFKEWLVSEVGLQSIDGVDGIAENNALIDEFLANIGELDQGADSISQTNATQLDDLLDEVQVNIEAWGSSGDPAILAVITQQLNEVERFMKSHYLNNDALGVALERIQAFAQTENASLGFIGTQLPNSNYFEGIAGLVLGLVLTGVPYDNDGNDILPITDEVIDQWKEVQEEAAEQLDDVALYTYGLNEEQIEVLEALAALEGSGFTGDMKAWLESIGLESPDSPDFTPEGNAEKIRAFMDQLAGGATPTEGGDAAIGNLQMANQAGYELSNVLEIQGQFGGGNSGPINGDKLADLREKFDFATEGGFDATGYALPSELAPGMEELWLSLPAGTRAQYGGDFQQFVTSLQLNRNDGPGNAAKLRAFLEGQDSSVAKRMTALLDVAATPINTENYPFSEAVQDGLQYLWSIMSPEDRGEFGNDINRWMTEKLGFDPSPASIPANLEKLKQAYSSSPLGAYVIDQIFAGKLDLDKSWKVPSPEDDKDNEFLEDLIDAGIIERPGEAPDVSTQASSNNDPATGDNLVTGAKSQGIPDGHDGRLMSLAQFEAYEQDAKDQLDGISEMSELDMLELQLKNDRRQRALETLSAVMKKTANTADGIISNMK